MNVLSFSLSDEAIEHLPKQGEPEVVQSAHHTQKDTIKVDERLELVEGRLPDAISEEEMDHHRQGNNPRHAPHIHHDDEEDGADALPDGGVEALGQLGEDVGQVVQVGDHSAELDAVAENVAEVETVCSDMVKHHLFKVISTLIEQQCLEKVLKVEAPSHEAVGHHSLVILKVQCVSLNISKATSLHATEVPG